MDQSSTGTTPTQLRPWRERARKAGLESQAENAMERGDLAYYQFKRWKYTDETDWQDWLTRYRVGGHSAGNADG